MTRTWALIVGGLFIFMFGMSLSYDVASFFDVDEPENTSGEAVDPDTKNDTNDDDDVSIEMIIGATVFLAEFGTFIAAIFMFVGIKAQNYKYIAPWLWMAVITIAVYLLRSLLSDETDKDIFFSILTSAIVAAFWYPIFMYYKQLRYSKCNENTVATSEKCCCHLNAAIYPSIPEFVHSVSVHPTYREAAAPSHCTLEQVQKAQCHE